MVIDFIETNQMESKGKSVLELSAHNGGLSLCYDLKGAKVVCSDLNEPTEEAQELHKRYQVSDGGIGSWNDLKAQKKCVACCYKCLKPGGRFIFADNMKTFMLHRVARRLFVKWGGKWYYETKKEIYMLMWKFKLVDERYVGVVGCFGRSEESRNRLGKIDGRFFKR